MVCSRASFSPVIARRRSRRGNPSVCRQSSSARVPVTALRDRSACTGYGLPRPLRGLAMTSKKRMSLRGAKRRGPQGSAACGGVKRPQRLGRHLPLHKQRAGQRLSANPEISRQQRTEKFQVNDTSLRLPRPLWGLAMTSVIWHFLHPGGQRPPLRRTIRLRPHPQNAPGRLRPGALFFS